MQHIRVEALIQAVIARHADEKPADTVERAEAFHAFLEQGNTAES